MDFYLMGEMEIDEPQDDHADESTNTGLSFGTIIIVFLVCIAFILIGVVTFFKT